LYELYKLKDWTENNKNVKVKIGSGQPEPESQIIDTLLNDIKKQETFYTNLLQQNRKEISLLKKEVSRLQKEFNNRTKWTISLDGELKMMQKAIQTKDAQIQNLYNELVQVGGELTEIKNSVMYGMTSKIARKLDEIAPESTRRRNALKATSAAYLMRKEMGTRRDQKKNCTNQIENKIFIKAYSSTLHPGPSGNKI